MMDQYSTPDFRARAVHPQIAAAKRRSAPPRRRLGALEPRWGRRHALRQEGGYSYTVVTDYDPIDTEQAAIVALADTHPEKQDAALVAFADVLAKLRWGTVERSDIDATAFVALLCYLLVRRLRP
jgi:hypothetical protein